MEQCKNRDVHIKLKRYVYLPLKISFKTQLTKKNCSTFPESPLQLKKESPATRDKVFEDV